MKSAPGYRQMVAMAWPIILANSATPLLALVDTAVIGNLGSVVDLGAIALGGLLFNFLFWGFGFLRMGTSGYVAQAVGRGDSLEVAATVVRGLTLAALIGIALILLQGLLIDAAMRLFGAGEAVQQTTREYFHVRIWGAPACLGLYVLMGFFIGSGATRTLLLAQLILNGVNILLDILFAGVMGWGARGIALGTVVAEWSTLGIALVLGWRHLRTEVRARLPQLRLALVNVARLRGMLLTNGDILLRTLALLLGFAIFTDQGARFGDATLAANHVLLQLISFSAFFLDGFAFSTEALAGRALGGGDRRVFSVVVRRSSQLAALTAVALAILLMAGGAGIIERVTDMTEVRAIAVDYLPFCALYVLVSFPAFQLDGIFIGTTQTRALRNASLLSTSLFAATVFPLASVWANTGLWSAFILFVVVRALTLAMHYPRSFPAGRGAGGAAMPAAPGDGGETPNGNPDA